MISHPKVFVVNIIYAGEHPKATLKALAQAVYDYCPNKGHIIAEDIGKLIGECS
jgi:hypothetical protein